jgi:hypothetical protein
MNNCSINLYKAQTLFWISKWLGDSGLKDKFSSFYIVACNTNALFSKMGT